MRLFLLFFRDICMSYYERKTFKEEFKMKDWVKLAAVGVAGYLLGFYEFKYKMMKILLENAAKGEGAQK